MKRGAKFLVSTTILAVAGCNGEQGKLEIRSTQTPLAQGQQPCRIASPKRVGSSPVATWPWRSRHSGWLNGKTRTVRPRWRALRPAMTRCDGTICRGAISKRRLRLSRPI